MCRCAGVCARARTVAPIGAAQRRRAGGARGAADLFPTVTESAIRAAAGLGPFAAAANLPDFPRYTCCALYCTRRIMGSRPDVSRGHWRRLAAAPFVCCLVCLVFCVRRWQPVMASRDGILALVPGDSLDQKRVSAFGAFPTFSAHPPRRRFRLFVLRSCLPALMRKQPGPDYLSRHFHLGACEPPG